jgi:hypothetical protein
VVRKWKRSLESFKEERINVKRMMCAYWKWENEDENRDVSFILWETKVKMTPTTKLGFLWPLIIVFETRHVLLLFVWFWKENGRKENKVEEK